MRRLLLPLLLVLVVGCSEEPLEACGDGHWLDEHPVESYGCVPVVVAEDVVLLPVLLVLFVINPEGASSQYATDSETTDASTPVASEPDDIAPSDGGSVPPSTPALAP